MLVHRLIRDSAERDGSRNALTRGDTALTYAALWTTIEHIAAGMQRHGLARHDRVAVYLPKTLEGVAAMFAANLAGGIFVPVNPVLKAAQVAHIVADCGPRFLVTSRDRWQGLEPVLSGAALDVVPVLIDDDGAESDPLTLSALAAEGPLPIARGGVDSDVAAILYTSGSTGRPKGVVLSHRNIVTGAHSVAEYLKLTHADRLLAVLPLSFDYGLNQLTTAFLAGGEAVLMDYLLPRDVVKAAARHAVTGLAGVPPLWNQLARLEWPESAMRSLRYITNSGGAMPVATTEALRARLPHTDVYLMYGLTEAFRSTFLPPEEVDRRPTSMGKAVPNAEVSVVRPDGSECAPHEPGELVHRGPLVALGYWNDPEKTRERFRPAPRQLPEVVADEIAVWSGDRVYRDEEGFLYFVARDDAMIKSSGYRISPEEIEELFYASGMVEQCAAIGVPDADLGQRIVVVCTAGNDGEYDAESLLARCKATLPNYMVPHRIERVDELPRNPNGKIDRKALAAALTEPAGAPA